MRIILTVLLAFLLAGCSSIVKVNTDTAESFKKQQAIAYNKTKYPLKMKTLTPKAEEEEQVFKKPPQRIVGVWQNSMETPMALGVGDRLIAAIGLPNDKSLRPEYRDLYNKIAYRSLEHLDVETMLMLEPELIIGWSSTFGPKVLRSTDFWHSRGVNTYIARNASPLKGNRTLENELLDIQDLGKILDRQQEAEKIVSDIKREIELAKEEAAKYDKKKRALIIEFMGKNIMAYGEKSLAGNMVQLLNAELLAANERTLSFEQLIEFDPDVLFVIIIESHYGKEDLMLQRIYDNKALRSLKCVQNKNIIPLPFYCVYTSGVRSYDGIKLISGALYPELRK